MTDIEADTGTRDETLELRSGALRLALRPDLGGSVAGLWHHHVPVWCSTEPHALVAAEQAACIPLVPYAYRLGYARLRWKGQDLRLEPDASAHPHALHGVGWRQRWALRSHSPLDAVLASDHRVDACRPTPVTSPNRSAWAGDHASFAACAAACTPS